MNKFVHLLPLFVVVFLMAGFAQAQVISLDGDSTDWAGIPNAIEWVNNQAAWYPSEVGAAVTDVVNVRHVKVTMSGRILYVFMRFHGTPAWPNNVDERTEGDGNTYFRSRGYYHLLLDLDNDPTTGWDNDYYETHYTPVGYLRSQGQSYDNIGSEGYVYWGCSYNTSYNGGGVSSMGYGEQDHSEKDYQANTGVTYDLWDEDIADPDSAKALKWQGSLECTGTDGMVPSFVGKSFWAGHAWGPADNPEGIEFIEMGYEITAHIQHFAAKGKSVFNKDDVIGFAAFIETPADDWGVDMTDRGQFTVPDDVPLRPSNTFSFDGDSTDWAGVPTGVNWVNNQAAWYPSEVGAAVTDVVNVRNVKVVVNNYQNAIFTFMRMWDTPAWPNNVDERTEGDGNTYFRSRGYYHVLLDLDNDPTTGWDTDYYETHYTPVGYLRSQGQQYDNVGSESYVYWGCSYNTAYNGGGVSSMGYGAQDHSEKDYQANTGVTYDIWDLDINDPDSAKAMKYDGMIMPTTDNAEAVVVNGSTIWAAHAWGPDFLEAGYELSGHKTYWASKGKSYFQNDDVIGYAAFVETPADDWGVDMTSRGQTTVVTAIDDGLQNVAVAKEFALADNYPNPFNPSTTINFTVPRAANVKLVVYNTLGQKVRTLVDENMAQGQHSIVWNGRNDAGQILPTGLYFYNLNSDKTSITKKMLLVK